MLPVRLYEQISWHLLERCPVLNADDDARIGAECQRRSKRMIIPFTLAWGWTSQPYLGI